MDRSRYPDDWEALSCRIRFERAQGHCECRGECGVDHASELAELIGPYDDDEVDGERCNEANGQPHTMTGARVVLTVAHLNHTPSDNREENLRAMCQRCHLSYDRDRHLAKQRANRRSRLAVGELFEGGDDAE